ncbi:helix-turn-helix domain-containing protein [Aquibacillus albus]|uniref:YesN/AraC family two-component response regulator n=1 Tax=Aquibacillus albus TaxID=1168171 RepID=A0ABS2N2W0_9BACI|nr:helix-turn-helix domain-containing protein [Aquibacillus albus]MBM7572448.1 YesN/AraC family two-component response regulator [Aquibacillus albus]
MRNLKLPVVFRRFLISYIIILLIPILTGLISYQVTMSSTEAYSIKNSKQVLNLSKTILEQRFSEIDRFGMQLASNKNLITLLQKKDSEKVNIVAELRELSENVTPYASTNKFLEDFYIYLKNTELIITPGSVFYRPNHFYRMNNYPNLTFEEWKSEMLMGGPPHKILPSQAYFEKETNTSVITYVITLPMNNFHDPLGAIVVPVEQEKINELLKGIPEQFGGWSFIIDEKNRIMTTTGINEKEIQEIIPLIDEENNTKYMNDGTLLISIDSDKNNWVYVAGIPKEALLKDARKIKYITWTVAGSTLIIGLIICLLFAYKNSLPITKILQTMKEQLDSESKPKNEYDFIHGSVSKLISKNTELQAQLDDHKPLLKDVFLKQILSGELSGRMDKLQDLANQVDVHLYGKHGFISVLKVDGYQGVSSSEIYEELNTIRVLIKNESEKMMKGLYMTNLNSDKIVCIFFGDKTEKSTMLASRIEKMLSSLQRHFMNNYRISLKVGLGHEFTSMKDISRSYNEAKQAVDFVTLSNDEDLYWYNDMLQQSTVFYYPLDYEFRLLNHLKEGESVEINRIIQELFDANFKKRCLAADMMEQFLFEVKGTFLKAFEESVLCNSGVGENLRKKLLAIRITDGVDPSKEVLMKVVNCYCNLVNVREQESNTITVKNIKNYLHGNYHQADLTIYMIAEYIGRPEKYISQVFRDQTGEYLSEYLEKIRISKGSQLLISTNKKIDDIASLVGYNSAHSFRRAFKRMNKITPNQYRKTAETKSG